MRRRRPARLIAHDGSLGRRCDRLWLALAVRGGELGPHARQALAQLWWLENLDGAAEAGDLTGERLDVVTSELDLDPTVGRRRSDADAVAEYPTAELDGVGGGEGPAGVSSRRG